MSNGRGDRRTELIEDCNGVLPVDHGVIAFKRAEEGSYKRDGGEDGRESVERDEKEGENVFW